MYEVAQTDLLMPFSPKENCPIPWLVVGIELVEPLLSGVG